jgi:hypothetical protein
MQVDQIATKMVREAITSKSFQTSKQGLSVVSSKFIFKHNLIFLSSSNGISTPLANQTSSNYQTVGKNTPSLPAPNGQIGNN